NDQTSSRLPAFSLFAPEAVQTIGTTANVANCCRRAASINSVSGSLPQPSGRTSSVFFPRACIAIMYQLAADLCHAFRYGENQPSPILENSQGRGKNHKIQNRH